MIFNVKAKKEQIQTFLIAHWNSFFLEQDAVKDCSSFEVAINYKNVEQKSGFFYSISRNIHYFIPLVVMIIHMGDSVRIMAKENFKYNATGMENLFTHRIFQKEFWHTGSVIIHIVIFMNICTLALYTFKSGLESRFVIFACKDTSVPNNEQMNIVQNGKVWKQSHAERFLAFRKRARATMKTTQITVYLLAFPYWTNGLMVNFTGDVRDYVFFAYLPFFILYSAFACVFVSFYIMLSASYMALQQTYLLEEVRSLTKNVIKMTNRFNKAEATSSETIWRRFRRTNGKVLAFFDQLAAVSRFWSPYLTVYFACHISMEVFLMYGFIFNHGSAFDLLKKSYFIYFTVEFMILLIAITTACSALVRHNVAIYKTNITFAYTFSRCYKPNSIYLLKMSMMVSNHKGMRSGFRLTNNYIVDSKMFEIIFFYISTLFMKLFSN